MSRPLQKYDKLGNAHGLLTAHENTVYHKNAVLMSKDFLNNLENNIDVSKLIDKGRKKQAEINRAILKSIVKTVMLCGQRNFPLRGDNAGKGSSSYLFNLAMASTGKFYCGFAFLYIILMYLDFFNSLKS